MRLKTREKKNEKLLYHYVEACKTSIRTQVSLLKDQRFYEFPYNYELPLLLLSLFEKHTLTQWRGNWILT